MQRIATVARQTKKHITELNLFDDGSSHPDPFDLRTGILSTRIYIILLAVSVITLIVFNSMGTRPEIMIILNPSESDYEDFLNKYGNSSSCPCSHITIPYTNFTSPIVNYHPVCQSIFLSNLWINHLFNPDFINLYQADFRALASSYFQLLATFCSHVKRSVNDTLDNFHLQTFLTPNVLLKKAFSVEVAVNSQFLRSSIVNSVHELLQLVLTTSQSNGLHTAIPISTMMFMINTNGVDILRMKNTLFRYTKESICSCSSTRRCSMPSGFFNISQRASSQIQSALYITPLANVSGFFVGCLPIESLLQSTLECLFDSSCLNTIHTFIPSSNIAGVYALNASQTRFSPNTSIEILINQLFIEEWLMKGNYSNYYTECAPIHCIHTLSKRNSPLYIITELLGLYGGLAVTLYFCVPRFVAFWRKRRVIAATAAEPRPSEYLYLKRCRLKS